MIHRFYNQSTASEVIMTQEEAHFSKEKYNVKGDPLMNIAWNTGADQNVDIDGVSYNFPSQSVIPLVGANTFVFERSEDVVAWQFNREFYCVIDHDKEVSCVGFIFYGSKDQLFIELDEKNLEKLSALRKVFQDEYEEKNEIQEEMLRMLIKRLIILITRLGKQQYLASDVDVKEEGLIRKFNLLLEQNYKQYHQVQDYASLLHKSPKTLSNLFAKYNSKSPLQVIKERIILEAKRLLQYTEMTSKEIAFELGFDDPATFRRFFKNGVSQSPTEYKKIVLG